MKLKFLGHICPTCGDACSFWGPNTRRQKLSGWMGYYYWSVCYRCHEAYLVLFNHDRKFIAIVPNGGQSELSGVLTHAGQLEPDEIPF